MRTHGPAGLLATLAVAFACGSPGTAPSAPASGGENCPAEPILDPGFAIDLEAPRRGAFDTPCGRDGEVPGAGESIAVLPLEAPSRVMVHLQSRFRPVLFVRSDCVDTLESVVACASGWDMNPPRRRREARLWEFEFTLDEGTHYLLVDGFESGGPLAIAVDVLPARGRAEGLPGLAELERVCTGARVLESGVGVGSGLGSANRFESPCEGYGFGPERVYAIDVERRSSVRIDVTSRFDPVVYVRSRCEDPGTTLWCETGGEGEEAEIAGAAAAGAPPVLGTLRSYEPDLREAGRYYFFVDSRDEDAVGADERFTIRAEISSRRGRSRGR